MLFVDTHERSSIYPPPFLGGDATDVGEGRGHGATINVPLPSECKMLGQGLLTQKMRWMI